MFPILVDFATIHVALAGKGEALLKRLSLLRANGAMPRVFSPAANRDLVDTVGEPPITPRLPTDAELADIQVLFIAGLETGESKSLSAAAQRAKVLVNLEDDKTSCDFHVPAIARRGDLVISISTNGTSPALSHILKRRIEAEFGDDWSEHTKAVARWRQTWRAEGIDPSEIISRTQNLLCARGVLHPPFSET